MPLRESRTGGSWMCPECGRRFVRRTREHSCQLTALDTHLQRTTPEARAAFGRVREILEGLGPLEIVALKTMITFRVTRNFAGVTVKKTVIDLGFFLQRRVTSGRVERIERISPLKIAHHVSLTSAADVDAELVGWLREAYQTCAN